MNYNTKDIFLERATANQTFEEYVLHVQPNNMVVADAFGNLVMASTTSFSPFSSSHAVQADFALTASYAVSASYEINYDISSSWASESISSSHALRSDVGISASYSLSSSHARQSDGAISASHALASDVAISSSHALASDTAISASYVPNLYPQVEQVSASWASASISASYAPNLYPPETVPSASWVSASARITTADTASYVVSSNVAGTVESASYSITASYAGNIPDTSSYALQALSASRANDADRAISASYAPITGVATNAETASIANSLSFVPDTAASASWASSSISASYATTASHLLDYAPTISASWASSSLSSSYVSASYSQIDDLLSSTITVNKGAKIGGMSEGVASANAIQIGATDVGVPLPDPSYKRDGAVQIGWGAGQSVVTASNAVQIGIQAGTNTKLAHSAVQIGSTTGANTTTASNAVQIGVSAGQNSIDATNAVQIGSSAGANAQSGSYTTFIGSGADTLEATLNVQKSIAIGFNAKVSGSNMAVIGGTGADAVNVGIGTNSPQATLHVVGNISASSVTASLSGTASYAITSSYSVNGIISGTDNYFPFYVNNGLTPSSSLYQSASHIAVGLTNPTALLHITSSPSTAPGNAPIKLTSAPLLATSEPGAIEFYNDDYYASITSTAGTPSGYLTQVPNPNDATTVKSSGEFVDGNYKPSYATNTGSSLTGGAALNSWLTANGQSNSMRVNIDIGSAKPVIRIYYENWHNSGTGVNIGCKDFTFWGSNTSFSDTTYGNDAGWTQLTTDVSQMVSHSASDTPEPRYITVTNSTSYRYYSFKFATNWGADYNMGMRRIELQTGVYLNTDARKIVTLSEQALTSGSIPAIGLNGRLVNSAITFTSQLLSVTSSQSTSSSYAVSASYAPNLYPQTYQESASWASASLSSSVAATASYFSGSILFYGNTDGYFPQWVGNALSATSSLMASGSSIYVGGGSGSLVGTASWANRATIAASSSWVSASAFITTAQTASYVLQAVSASRAISAATASAIYMPSGSGAWRLEISSSGDLVFLFS